MKYLRNYVTVYQTYEYDLKITTNFYPSFF